MRVDFFCAAKVQEYIVERDLVHGCANMRHYKQEAVNNAMQEQGVGGVTSYGIKISNIHMKQFVLLFALVATVFCAQAQQQERVSDFRNIQWGAMKDSIWINGELAQFTPVKGVKFKNAYTLEQDDMSIGNVPLNKVYYIFNEQGRFYKVFIEGTKADTREMAFIIDYKFGQNENETKVDGITYKQWLIHDVTFTLAEHEYHTFELEIESDWQAAEAYRKNTSVSDF